MLICPPDLHFEADTLLCGASIETYLLEKSRLVGQSKGRSFSRFSLFLLFPAMVNRKGERCFHVFYQLLAGATPDMRSSFLLPNIDSCTNLTQVPISSLCRLFLRVIIF